MAIGFCNEDLKGIYEPPFKEKLNTLMLKCINGEIGTNNDYDTVVYLLGYIQCATDCNIISNEEKHFYIGFVSKLEIIP